METFNFTNRFVKFGAERVAYTRELDPTSSLAALFGFELRQMREQTGVTQEQLGTATYCSTQQVSQIETAARLPSKEFARLADEALGASGRLIRLHNFLTQDRFPPWARPFVEFEARAVRIRTFETVLVPGLLQTERYVRALHRAGQPRESADQIEERVAARLDRQQLLKSENPPHVWAIMDESVLVRPVGGPDVLREQLAKLIELSESPHTVIQVIPFAAGAHASLDGPMSIFTLDDGEEVAYIEGLRTGTVVAAADEVQGYNLTYDLVQADALSRSASVNAIRSAMERLST